MGSKPAISASSTYHIIVVRKIDARVNLLVSCQHGVLRLQLSFFFLFSFCATFHVSLTSPQVTYIRIHRNCRMLFARARPLFAVLLSIHCICVAYVWVITIRQRFVGRNIMEIQYYNRSIPFEYRTVPLTHTHT